MIEVFKLWTRQKKMDAAYRQTQRNPSTPAQNEIAEADEVSSYEPFL